MKNSELSGGVARRFELAGRTEVFLSTAPQGNESPEHVFQRVASFLRDEDLQVVSQEVFGRAPEDPEGLLNGSFGEVQWPVTWVQECNPARTGFCGTQMWTVRGTDLEVLRRDGQVVGTVLEDEHAKYYRLGGLLPPNTEVDATEQSRLLFDYAEDILHSLGIHFPTVVRTWFFNKAILDWYGDFNRVRDAFFKTEYVFDGVVPSSTGIAGYPPGPDGAALVAGLLAVVPKSDEVTAQMVPSPLQGPALDYGSSFSRATEVNAPGLRRLFVSGTASIDPEGATIHLGQTYEQLEETLRVVGAILESRGMGWEDVTRALAYFKNGADIGCFGRHAKAVGLPELPVLVVENDVCRGDLLFEIELDAVKQV